MKVVLSSQGDTLESALDSRFGRAAKFLLWDSADESVRAIDNRQSLDAPQGAGIQAAMTVAGQGADVVITGHCGPKAFRVLKEAGIKIYLTQATSISEALKQFQDGALREADNADVEGHWA